MPHIFVLPHDEVCPTGCVIAGCYGEKLCELLLRNGVDIEHVCDQNCACTSCHVWVKEGFESFGAC